ncbi:hypothetical protein PMI14_01206 [Acidovorax sp. CF316]|uniref:hypothetical protein n=1 Tax=Acidovorax sp. CF316 TaxID=1144317 RepID=UPI00026BDAB7|nr:hypothetical protein [Acidovorax sp. CF316]EJE53905.1 hypothetical protein PMI14_01206 [Acidovorax sp. CF316]
MNVIDHEPASWFLVQHGDQLLLDVNCHHSFVSYSVLVALSEEETSLYRQRGHAYLNELAHAIHYSAPGVAGSRSPYKERNVDREFGAQVMAAIQAHRAQQAAGD